MATIEVLPNGLTVIIEEISHVESAAYELAIPGGILADDPAQLGQCLLLAELVSRGAGSFDSRALSDAFDSCGIRHGEGASLDRYTLRGTLLAEHLPEALRLTSLMVSKPTLPEGEIENIRQLLLQDLASLKDNPSSLVMVELNKHYFPEPYGRPTVGTEEGIRGISAKAVAQAWQKLFCPKGAVLSIAGKVRTRDVLESAKESFGPWLGEAFKKPVMEKLPPHRQYRYPSDSAQVQIALAFPSAPFGDEHYYTAKVATNVLSGGMYGRLFIEVREKRGLVYNVYARHMGTEQFGLVVCYAGTTPERAQETLDVMVKELRSVAGTVTDEELMRARANIKASLVMSEESTAARAGANANDYLMIKKLRSIKEILESINKVDAAAIDEYLTAYPANSFMLQTLGSRELSI